MNIGITYDEKMFEGDYIGGFESLYEMGFSNFEFSLHEKLMPMDIYKSIFGKMNGYKAGCSFHVPNFIKSANLTVDDFQPGSSVQYGFEAQFEAANELYSNAFDGNVQASYILHGLERHSFTDEAESRKSEKRLLQFIDFVCNYMESRSLRLFPLLENTYEEGGLCYPSKASDLNSIMERFKDYPLGICLDTAHFMQQEESLDALKNKAVIKQFHIHGFKRKPYISHFPLSLDEEQAKQQMELIRNVGMDNRTVVLEILGMDKMKYIHSCKYDMELMAKIPTK